MCIQYFGCVDKGIVLRNVFFLLPSKLSFFFPSWLTKLTLNPPSTLIDGIYDGVVVEKTDSLVGGWCKKKNFSLSKAVLRFLFRLSLFTVIVLLLLFLLFVLYVVFFSFFAFLCAFCVVNFSLPLTQGDVTGGESDQGEGFFIWKERVYLIQTNWIDMIVVWSFKANRPLLQFAGCYFILLYIYMQWYLLFGIEFYTSFFGLATAF